LGDFSPDGRVFALGSFFEKFRNFLWATFLRYKRFDKNGLGHILDEFLINSSGHPASVFFFFLYGSRASIALVLNHRQGVQINMFSNDPEIRVTRFGEFSL
jgi:hypothetical protein